MFLALPILEHLQFHPGKLEVSAPPRATVDALLQSPKRWCHQWPRSLPLDRLQMLLAGDPSLHYKPALACNQPCSLRHQPTWQALHSPSLSFTLIPTFSLLHLIFFPSLIFPPSQSLPVSSETLIALTALSCFYPPNLTHCKSPTLNL